MATTNGSTAIRDKILASLARYRALRIGKFPCAFWRLSAHPGLTAIDDFRNSTQTDQIITLLPTKETQRDIRKQYPDIQFKALTIRLIKYTLEGKTYCIGTTLLDERYTIDALKEVYHARWGIEELYKISKNMIVVDDFHGRSERTVKQELFAHFVLITMSRLCTNESENLLRNKHETTSRY
ncbi:hypothetical protein BPLS_P6011 [Bathymodiolus platifrons methanotrophic gill symbiont]|uniref:transposase n=1 Tax=Bathymodiolus platifrons methanotrophic gill symbiont TaxID=113268 RepID=UPI001B50D1FE|nr:transposase [Bathymodiolus platifrons methanotrophic gill symbiont]GFO77529.1 hypothetical protein BPLS_P6011 [Bathymodiolus platifrons methanotrophic gill symbiont]